MRDTLLPFIQCLRCEHDAFDLICDQREGEHILEGQLCCLNCYENYPIVRGVPRFLPKEFHERVKNNVANFGEQWKTYCTRLSQNRLEFQSYFEYSGLDASTVFQKKTVLDAGCGSGKFAAIAGEQQGVKLLGMDLSESVEVAFKATQHLANVHIIQADILDPPLKPETFDWVYSIGVLHHTEDPPGSFRSLSRFLKPAGHFFFWLYAKEGNRLYLTLFDPIRVHVTRHLPVWLNNAVAWLIAVLSWPLVILYALLQKNKILDTWAKKHLPLYAYLLYFHQVGFWLWRNTILDKMIPHIAYHYSQEELFAWLDGFSLETMTFRNGNSWAILAQKNLAIEAITNAHG